LEFIDEDVAERADIATVLCIARGTQDHVLEVDPALEEAIAAFVEHYNHQRYHESLGVNAGSIFPKSAEVKFPTTAVSVISRFQ
jgi:transposase InsO family protein